MGRNSNLKKSRLERLQKANEANPNHGMQLRSRKIPKKKPPKKGDTRKAKSQVLMSQDDDVGLQIGRMNKKRMENHEKKKKGAKIRQNAMLAGKSKTQQKVEVF